MSLAARILKPTAIAALLALATSACGAPSTACYGISDAEALKIARTNLAGSRMKDDLMNGWPIAKLVPMAIQRDRYERGQDGAVRVLFRDPASSRAGGVYQEIFEDCDTEWRVDADGKDVNGGSPWQYFVRPTR